MMNEEAFRAAIDQALDDALAQRPKYLGWVAAGALLSLGLMINFQGDPGQVLLYLFPAIMIAGLAALSFSRHVRDHLMPVMLGHVFGLTFRPQSHKPEIEYLTSLGLLPRGGWKTAEAEAIGRIGGMLVRVWGVESTRSGRSRRTYPSYICEFPAKVGWEGVSLAPRRFYGWWFSTLPRARFNQQVYRPFRRVGEIYSVGFHPEGVRISDLSRRIEETNRLFQDWAAFAGAHFDRDRSLIVIQDNTLPLRMFGIFLTRDQILRRLSSAMEELSLPLRIAEIWGLLPDATLVTSNDAPALPKVSGEARSTG